MKELFQLITIAGCFYLAGLVLHSNAVVRRRLSHVFSKERVLSRLENEKFREVFKKSGIKWSSSHVNALRFGGVIAYLLLDGISRFLTKMPYSLTPFLLACLVLLVTSTTPISPLMMLLKKLSRRQEIHRDSELIAFTKFYENNRMRDHPMQLHFFCRSVAPQFSIIQHELFQLSERLIDKSMEEALEWWVDQYHSENHFISEVRTMILTSENASREDARQYLQSQSKYLSKLSSDQYKKKGMFAADLAKLVTGIPSILAFAMVIVFVFMYLAIIKNQTNVLN